MTKTDINKIVLEIIFAGANTKKLMKEALEKQGIKLSDDDLDNALRRLKSEELAAFNKEAKQWATTTKGSASLNDGTVGSADTNQPEPPASNESKMPTENTTNVADIDSAIANAKKGTKQQKPKTEGKRPRLSDDEKKARDEAKAKLQAEKKEAREKARAEKKAQREAAKKAPHMSKVDKAAERLPKLDERASEMFTDATTNLSATQLMALSAHLIHFNRAQATTRALAQKVEVGDKVRIVSGDNARYIGMEGTVEKAQRIRCYVKVPDQDKLIYLFTSNVEPVDKQAAKAAAG